MPEPAERHARNDDRRDHDPLVVRSALLAAGGFATTVISLLAAAGQWQIPDGTVRFAIIAITGVMALALFIAAAYVMRR